MLAMNVVTMRVAGTLSSCMTSSLFRWDGCESLRQLTIAIAGKPTSCIPQLCTLVLKKNVMPKPTPPTRKLRAIA